MQSGATSHAALLASTLGVPVAGGVPELASQLHDGDMVIVDGNHGHVLVHPTGLAVREYSIRQEIFHRFRGELAGLREAPAETLDGHRVRLTVNVGLAEEVPHALDQGAEGTIPDILATEAEFFSIGSNDLIQYTLAADRTNPRVTYIYEPLHLAVLRMMQTIIRAGHQCDSSVSLCGEMASDPIYTIILLGLGVDDLSPKSIVLFNESFASTNEREGSEIARQIVRALLERGIKVFYVTHLFDLAQGFHRAKMSTALFLRAERLADGQRTFRLVESEPLPTSHAEDLYRRVFGTVPVRRRDGSASGTRPGRS